MIHQMIMSMGWVSADQDPFFTKQQVDLAGGKKHLSEIFNRLYRYGYFDAKINVTKNENKYIIQPVIGKQYKIDCINIYELERSKEFPIRLAYQIYATANAMNAIERSVFNALKRRYLFHSNVKSLYTVDRIDKVVKMNFYIEGYKNGEIINLSANQHLFHLIDILNQKLKVEELTLDNLQTSIKNYSTFINANILANISLKQKNVEVVLQTKGLPTITYKAEAKQFYLIQNIGSSFQINLMYGMYQNDEANYRIQQYIPSSVRMGGAGIQLTYRLFYNGNQGCKISTHLLYEHPNFRRFNSEEKLRPDILNYMIDIGAGFSLFHSNENIKINLKINSILDPEISSLPFHQNHYVRDMEIKLKELNERGQKIRQVSKLFNFYLEIKHRDGLGFIYAHETRTLITYQSLILYYKSFIIFLHKCIPLVETYTLLKTNIRAGFGIYNKKIQIKNYMLSTTLCYGLDSSWRKIEPCFNLSISRI